MGHLPWPAKRRALRSSYKRGSLQLLTQVAVGLQPTLEETRRLLRDFEGLSVDMAAAGVDVEALAGKLRSLQGSLDACSDEGARTSVAAGVLAEVGAAAGGEERRVALCRVLLQKNDRYADTLLTLLMGVLTAQLVTQCNQSVWCSHLNITCSRTLYMASPVYFSWRSSLNDCPLFVWQLATNGVCARAGRHHSGLAGAIPGAGKGKQAPLEAPVGTKLILNSSGDSDARKCWSKLLVGSAIVFVSEL